MKKFEVYWNITHDKHGQERRYPMMVVSNDASNETSMFATTIRLTTYEKYQSPAHIKVPREAWSRTSEIGEAIALCETVGSARKMNLYGPISFLGNPDYQKKINDTLKTFMDLDGKNIASAPVYSGAIAPQGRETIPMADEMAKSYVEQNKDAYVYRTTGGMMTGMEPHFTPTMEG